jgi:hypothetical protein
MEITKHLNGRWQVGMIKAACKRPLTCLGSLLFPCCIAYSHRKELLQLTNEPYVCCGGLCGCGPCSRPCNPGCLVVESCCCLQMAIAGNRFMIQTRFDRKNTKCDNFIISVTSVLILIGFCISLIVQGDAGKFCKEVADLLLCIVNSCMQSQHRVELDYLKSSYSNSYPGMPSYIVPILPQHMHTYIVIAPTQQEMQKQVVVYPHRLV